MNKHLLRCERCGRTVEYSRTGYLYASRAKRFLCKKCKGKSGIPNLRYAESGFGVLRCPKCEKEISIKKPDIYGYKRRYGEECERYVCRECSHKKYDEFRVCSVCGRREYIETERARRYYKEAYSSKPYVCKDCKKKQSEESRTLVCRKCGDTKVVSFAEASYWKYNEAKGKSYVCRKCRKINADAVVSVRGKTISAIATKECKELVSKCKRLYAMVAAGGFSESSVDAFLDSLSSLLRSVNIYDFDLNAVDGKIIGIYLHGVSIYGELYLPFERTAKAFGRRGIPS